VEVLTAFNPTYAIEMATKGNASDAIAATPSLVLDEYMNENPQLVASREDDVVDFIKSEADLIKADPINAKLTAKQYAAKVDTAVLIAQETALALIGTEDKDNIFHAPPMPVLLKRAEVAANPYVKKFLAESKMTTFNPQELAAQGYAALIANETTIEELALGMQTLFKGAVAHNNTFKFFSRRGMKNQDSYNFKAHKPGLFGGENIIMDGTDITKWKEIINYNRVEAARALIESNVRDRERRMGFIEGR
jgi:hypothetical protein